MAADAITCRSIHFDSRPRAPMVVLRAMCTNSVFGVLKIPRAAQYHNIMQCVLCSCGTACGGAKKCQDGKSVPVHNTSYTVYRELNAFRDDLRSGIVA